MKSTIIDKEAVDAVVGLLLRAEAAVGGDGGDEGPDGGAAAAAGSAMRVVDAFLVPKLRYDPIKKLFYEYVHGEFGFWTVLLIALVLVG